MHSEWNKIVKQFITKVKERNFQPSWIKKFKADIRDRGANIEVLVTEVIPSDMDRMGLKDGIWLFTVLREGILQVNNAIVTQENKGDKMDLLYD